MKILSTLKPGIFLVLACCSNPASAWYQVEVIVFQYLQPETDGEQFAENPPLPETEGAIELTSGGAEVEPAASTSTFAAYRIISPSRYRLASAYQALRSSHDYKPLLHIAWEQPAAGEGPTRVVHLQQSAGTTAPVAESAEATADRLAELQTAGTIVDGTVRVRSGRFLHVDVDMAYFPIGSDPGSANVVRLRTTRKIKLNELNYLDHPLFGVLLEVSRLSPDATDAQPQDQPADEAGDIPED